MNKINLIKKIMKLYEHKRYIKIDNTSYGINHIENNFYIIREVNSSKRLNKFINIPKYNCTWLAEFGLYETYMLLYTYLDQLSYLDLEKIIFEYII